MGDNPGLGGSSRRASRRDGTATRWLVAGAFGTGGVGVTVAVAAAWIPLRTGHSNVVVALALVAAITLLGVTGRRSVVVGAALGAAAAFTFFDTTPFDRFAMSRQPDIATAVLLVGVGVLAGELAVRTARQRRSDRGAAGGLTRVREAADLLAHGEELVLVIGAVADKLCRVLDLEDCWFTVETLPPVTALVGRDGAVAAIPEPAIPDRRPGDPVRLALPVLGLGQVVGHFVLVPRHGAPLRPAELLVAVTLADQAGAALAAQAAPVPGPSGPDETGEPPDPSGPRREKRTPRLRVVP